MVHEVASPLNRPSDLLGRHVRPQVDPVEIRDPPGLPGGQVVRVYENEARAPNVTFLLVKLDRVAEIPLPSRELQGRVGLRYVLVQLDNDWEEVKLHLKGRLADWRVKHILHGSGASDLERKERVEWKDFAAIGPGLLRLE